MRKILCFALFDLGCWLERMGNRIRPIEIQERIKNKQICEKMDLILAWKNK